MAPKTLTRLLLVSILFACATQHASGQAAAGSRQNFREPRAVELKAAIAASELDRVRALVGGVSTNDCLELDEVGGTALQYAVRQCLSSAEDGRAFQVLEELASRTACINGADRMGRRAILELAPLNWTSRSRMDALTILLAHGADVNTRDEHGATLLHQLLGSWNDSAMHWPELVPVLLAAKANPNLTNAAGQTPLHLFFGPHGFCSNKSRVSESTLAVAQQVFVLLVNAGADLTVRDPSGTTPLGGLLSQDEPFFGSKEAILGFATPSLAPQLRIQSAEIKHRPALIYLCDQGQGDSDLVERLLALGAIANQVEGNGFTALHAAAWFYNYRDCALLLNHGANANAQDENGRTPLHELVRSTYRQSPFVETDRVAGLLKTADVLLEHGADRKIRDKSGKTPLDFWKLSSPLDDERRELWRELRKKLR